MKPSLPLSTHVLYLGLPAEGLTVKLYKSVNGDWIESNEIGVTDINGRVEDFNMVNSEVFGTYKLRFETLTFLTNLNVESIFPYVEVIK